MDVILLERITKLGQMGDTVKVKDGYARNFLLPQGKALRANKANLTVFESQRVELEARNLERKSEAESVHTKLDGNSYIVIRSAGETGQLYGSVSTRDVAETLDVAGFKVLRNQVSLLSPIKVIGLHTITIALHPEVETTISVNVARSEDEAKLQAAGQDLTKRENYEMEPVEDEDELDLSEVFDDPEGADLNDEAESESVDSDDEVKDNDAEQSDEDTK
ncbi:MAG: 50S ribosomal protein L9 [Hyphomicrobiales bacterium]|nr:50S ribosomal protein L9 [Hyphomicrobiales bacterium]